jgi:antitoxin (DNA-binding transcriptional repressor) of toxin-antitoxin stability system
MDQRTLVTRGLGEWWLEDARRPAPWRVRLRLVTAGETVLVTDRNRVLAELSPPREGQAAVTSDALVANAVRKGWISPGRMPPGSPPPRLPVDRTRGDAVSQLFATVPPLELTPEVLRRAVEPFQSPVRTLDAFHPVSVELLHVLDPTVGLASHDHRQVEAARGLGIPICDGI